MADANTLEELAHPQYWDNRYSHNVETTYEWFRSYSTLKPFFEKHLPPTPSQSNSQNSPKPLMLHLGCGNSALSIDLIPYKYSQLCIDFSRVVIETMSALHAEVKDLDWRVMDVRNMVGIGAETIDVAIDKGTLDAMIHGSLFDPPEQAQIDTSAYINEVVRVLKPGGLFLYITYRQPLVILPILTRREWEVQPVKLNEGEGGFEYHGFVMRRNAG